VNRSERRRLEKKGVTAKDLKVIENNSASKAIDYAVSGMIASFALVLHDKWGWGQTRIKRLLDQVNEQFDSIDNDYLKIEDMKQTILDEIGINIDKKA